MSSRKPLDYYSLTKKVSALVCGQCGDYFLEDDVAGVIEEIVEKARASNGESEIFKLAP